MAFSGIQELRRAKLDERTVPAAGAQYSLPQRLIWCGVQVLRHAWLNVYAILALVAGVVFIFNVKQTRELLANLEYDWLFLGVLAAWAASIWYSMRVLSSTDFPGDAEPHPAAAGCTGWLNAETPRLAAFAGLVVIAATSSIFLTEVPSPHWIAPLCAGIVPLTWAVARLGNRSAGLEQGPVYRVSTLLAAAGAAAIAWYTWSTVPHAMRPDAEALHLEDVLIGACVVLTLVPLALKRTGTAAQWAMAGALALWAWVVFETARHHAGFSLPFCILALAAVGLWFVQARRRLFAIVEDPAAPKFDIGRPTVFALGVAFALQLALVVALTYSPIRLGMQIGTLGLFFLALALLAFFGIVWVFVPKYLTWPSLALVPLVWAVTVGNTPDHSLRGTKFAAKPAERPRLAEHYEQWRAQLPKRGDNPVFFVAAAGGGLRAAYWTATMLAAADDRTCGEFGRHVYAYSGVSGGSLGIAAYLAQRQVWEAKTPEGRCQTGRRAQIADMLGRDFLAPVAGSMLFAEMTQRYMPFKYLDEDRGTVLGKAWSAAWDDVFAQAKGRFDRPFLEIFGKAGPAVFLNATAVDTGRRAIASNVAARIPGAIDLFRPVREGALKTSGLTLREAVLNSARFTYVSPAATVHGCAKPNSDGGCSVDATVWDRLVDGGYFENSGLATLTDVMNAIPGDKSRFYVVVIDNSNESELACRQRRKGEFDANAEAPAGVPPLSGITAPIEALLHVREARGQLEVRRLATQFSCKERRILDWNLFGDQAERREAEAAGQEPALGWFLSRRSAKWISERAGEVALQFPFRHAACHDGPLPTEKVQTVVGERSQTNVFCPEPPKALKP
jgi:hypothetical protein